MPQATFSQATVTDFSCSNPYTIQNKQKITYFSKSLTSPDPDRGSKLTDGLKDHKNQ